MIEIWPLWWVDRALTAFSAIMDFESTIFRSIFIRKMIRHSFNYLLMLYVSYNLHESKEVLFVFHPLPNSFQVENSRKIHANPQSLNLTCSNAIMPFIVTSGCPTENRLRRDKVNWAVPTKGENWYKWFQYNAPLTGDDDASFAWRKEIALTQGAKLGRLIWCRAVRTLPLPEAECSWFRWTLWPEEYSREDFLWSWTIVISSVSTDDFCID